MFKLIPLVFALLLSQSLFAATDDQFQNITDLDTMVEYVESHPEVISSLKAIDFKNYTVEYGNACSVYFKRQKINNSASLLQQKTPLVVDHIHCKKP